jgi:hypothetical protein
MAKRTGLVAALTLTGAIAVGFLALIGAAGAGKKDSKSNRMNGFNEAPAVSAPGARGTIEVRIKNSSAIDFTLTYSNLSGNPAAAHIHLGQKGVSGGVVAFLCGGGGQAPCPGSTSGTVTGTISAANIQALPAQGIAGPADFVEVLAAIKAGVTYANVHTALLPTGEIRGQIKARGGGDDDDDD